MKKILHYLSLYEWILLIVSLSSIIASFFILKTSNILYLIASIVGVFSLIFCAKGNPIGEGLMVVFSIIYLIISFQNGYYGELISYGLTGIIAVLSLISWLKNPSKNKKSEVEISHIKVKEIFIALGVDLIISTGLFFVLKYFNTNNLILSIISVYSGFIAAYLTLRRSKLYGFAYMINDAILIAIWIIAALNDASLYSLAICFFFFFINDFYGSLMWIKREKSQKANNN